MCAHAHTFLSMLGLNPAERKRERGRRCRWGGEEVETEVKRQKQEVKKKVKVWLGDVSLCRSDSCLLACEGYVLSNYMHMCVNHAPFLALMLFLINSSPVSSRRERKSKDNEKLCGLCGFFFWWMSRVVTDAICQLSVNSKEFSRLEKSLLSTFPLWWSDYSEHTLWNINF